MENKNGAKLIFALIFIVLTFLYGGNKENIDEIINNINIDNTDIETNITDKPVMKVSGDLNIEFVDVGQADCILIENKGEYTLIDARNNEDGRKIVSYFEEKGITKFKYVIGTHAHEDHIGGMDNIIKAFDIETFYMPEVITTTRTFEEILDALEEKQIAFDTPEVDRTFKMGEAVFTTIYVGDSDKDLNDSSIVLRMDYGSTSYLFTGDATSNVEKKILNKDIDVDVLKVGHHGSQYSTTQNFLNKVTPKYAIIQVGTGNTYNHPRNETLTKLDDMKVETHRTDKEGTIVLTSDGKNISITTKNTDTNG